MEFLKHPKLTNWISFFLIFSLANLAIGQQKNDYSGLESIYEGILQGYNRNLRPGKYITLNYKIKSLKKSPVCLSIRKETQFY